MNLLRQSVARIQSKSQQRTFLSVIEKYKKAYETFGLKNCVWKMYNNGDIKFGEFVGEDRFGIKYYEDVNEVHGQQRWCEFPQNFDPIEASRIPPEWHAWLHQFTDAKPGEPGQDPTNWEKRPISSVSHAPYTSHMGPVDPDAYSPNQTGFHKRAYGVGSIFTEAENDDQYYMQPNHPLRNRRRNDATAAEEDIRDPNLP